MHVEQSLWVHTSELDAFELHLRAEWLRASYLTSPIFSWLIAKLGNTMANFSL